MSKIIFALFTLHCSSIKTRKFGCRPRAGKLSLRSLHTVAVGEQESVRWWWNASRPVL